MKRRSPPSHPCRRALAALVALGFAAIFLLPGHVTGTAVEPAGDESVAAEVDKPFVDPPEIVGLPGYRAGLVAAPEFAGEAYVVEAGPRGAPVVVLIHGISPLGAGDWYKILPALSKRHRVLAFDLPGFGRSTRGEQQYTPKRYAKFVEGIVRERLPGREEGSFFLVGHSLGGGVALEVAARQPDRIEALMLVDVAGVLHPKAFTHTMIDSRTDLGLLDVLVEPFRRGAHDLTNALRGEMAEFIDSYWGRALAIGDDPSRIAAIELFSHDFGPSLDAIRSPTLVVWGSEDRIAPMRTGFVLASRIPDARLLALDGVAHAPMRQAPDEFTRVVLAWLAGESQGIRLAMGAPGSQTNRSCAAENGVIFAGDFKRIRIEGCKDVILRNVRAQRLEISRATVQAVDTVVEGKGVAVSIIGSRVTFSGGSFSGNVALELRSAEIDLAGVSLTGAEASVVARGGAEFLCSVCRRQSPVATGRLHGARDLVAGDRL